MYMWLNIPSDTNLHSSGLKSMMSSPQVLEAAALKDNGPAICFPAAWMLADAAAATSHHSHVSPQMRDGSAGQIPLSVYPPNGAMRPLVEALAADMRGDPLDGV